jgi:hypothetical protein
MLSLSFPFPKNVFFGTIYFLGQQSLVFLTYILWERPERKKYKKMEFFCKEKDTSKTNKKRDRFFSSLKTKYKTF